MPEEPLAKKKPHPRFASHAEIISSDTDRKPAPGYVELQVTSNFTFLTGASHPDEMARQAAALEYRAIAITDTNTLAGIVRAHVAAKDTGIQLLVGCALKFAEPLPLVVLVYPTDLAAYGRLCTMLTVGKRRAKKGECHLELHDLIEHQRGLIAVAVPPPIVSEDTIAVLEQLRKTFDDDRLSLAVTRGFQADDAIRVQQMIALSERVAIPLVVTNDVHYHAHDRRMLQDVLTCIRHGCTVHQAGFKLHANAERHLKPPHEMHRLFADLPDALARTVEIADRCKGFSLDQLRYNYPDEIVPAGTSPMSHLRELTFAGAAERYPGGLPDKVRTQIEHELQIIEDLRYAPYFLTVQDIVRFARSKEILCQGRGAAANSAVCFCLGVTAVDPARGSMLFERFVSKERDEPPDIDIDFEHERREEVIQYLYAKYGRERAALTAEVISYRGRSAVRDVGKALGLSLDLVDRLAKTTDWFDTGAINSRRMQEMGVNPDEPIIQWLATLVGQLLGFPRHLSQHVGGFVITQTPLSELVPIENAAMDDRTVIEWDKDDIEALGMLKVDVLGLGMLTCLRKCFELVASSDNEHLTLATIPAEDSVTYDMICKADTIGVFQIESRAQMSMLPRLRPRCFYDLVIEVAIVRPGPIQGNMVHPYIKRRNGEIPVVYASPEIENVLGRTLGVPLFQEQCMSLAVLAAGFTPGEADQLRRAIASWKRKQYEIKTFEKKLIDGMTSRGYSLEFATQVFTQISGFSGYGFPESHAASFAILVYASCWLKRHRPAAFAAALLNSQPMGFYQPAQIVRDAQEHGVEVRPIDVNHSRWDCTLESGEKGHAIRLGTRLVKGLPQDHADAISAIVNEHGQVTSLDDLQRRTRQSVSISSLRHLARADAFGSLGLTRQAALWTLHRLTDERLPLFEGTECDSVAQDRDTARTLPPRSAFDEVSADYDRTQLSLKAHPLAFVRDELKASGVTPCEFLRDESKCKAGRLVSVAGLVLVRQRPGTASGIVFMTIEDETGIANLVLFPKIFERFRNAARGSFAIVARGVIEREGDVVHVKVRQLQPLELRASEFKGLSRDFH
ncbi:MAG: error-prone DNA polymerase [Phycisphaerales bacterium]